MTTATRECASGVLTGTTLISRFGSREMSDSQGHRVHSYCLHGYCLHGYCLHGYCLHGYCLHVISGLESFTGGTMASKRARARVRMCRVCWPSAVEAQFDWLLQRCGSGWCVGGGVGGGCCGGGVAGGGVCGYDGFGGSSGSSGRVVGFVGDGSGVAVGSGRGRGRGRGSGVGCRVRRVLGWFVRVVVRWCWFCLVRRGRRCLGGCGVVVGCG